MSAQVAAALLPRVSITKAVGAPGQVNDRPFDDLVIAGGWPVSQNIRRIERIEVFADTAVRGIRITYVTDTTQTPVLHGRNVGSPQEVSFDNDNMILVGVFGGRDSTGAITSIGFIRFDARNSSTTPIRVFGPFGSTSPAPARTFGTYGNIIALIGTDSNDSGLRSLGFVKSEDIARGLV